MKHRLLALLAAAIFFAGIAAPAAAQEAAGNWVGVLDVAPGNRLPLAVHIERDDSGAFRGTMFSLAQGVALPLAGITVEGGNLTFSTPTIGGSYKGQ